MVKGFKRNHATRRIPVVTKTKTINGLSFEVNQPYEAGQTINEAEARALNQTRSENIGNNVRAKVKEMQDAGKELAEIAAYVTSVDAEYVFTLANVSAAQKLDPYEREARNIARELLKAHLAQSGRKLTVAPEGVTKEDWDAKVESEVERIATSEAVVKQAKKNVDAKKKAADTLLESIGGVSV